MSDTDITANDGLPLVRPKIVPPLDSAFRPAAVANRFYRKATSQSEKSVRVRVAVERDDGSVSHFQTHVLDADHPQAGGNFTYLERLLKFLLWSRGGFRIHFAGPKELGQKLEKHYRSAASGKFDAKIMGERIYEKPFEFLLTSLDQLPPQQEAAAPLGRHLDGCRIGFDLGASDRKVAALQEGRTVYSAEFPWDPRNQADPQWHLDQITEMLKAAAEKLPRVDAIGGSSAGVYVQNQVKVASLFRAVPEDQFHKRVKKLFLEIQAAWNNIPLVVVNDGDVAALAGSMALNTNHVLGIAMGSSLATGYVNAEGNITTWLNELAFAPLDYNPRAPVDEWSGDYGCGVQYFSQQAVGRLIPASGLEIEDSLPLPDKLVAVQDFMSRGDERAASIYRTIGVYLGYTLPHYTEFYDFNHLLVLGRVTTGPGGALLVEEAKRVIQEEFPEFPVEFHIPDETEKRHGQAIAAASLPVIRK
jgi:predicted NBD/HSP70 family sugar kinase